jgi:hypothetical protein
MGQGVGEDQEGRGGGGSQPERQSPGIRNSRSLHTSSKDREVGVGTAPLEGGGVERGGGPTHDRAIGAQTNANLAAPQHEYTVMYLLDFSFNRRTGIALDGRFRPEAGMNQTKLCIPATASTRMVTTKATDATKAEPMTTWKNETWDCLRLNMMSLLLL